VCTSCFILTGAVISIICTRTMPPHRQGLIFTAGYDMCAQRSLHQAQAVTELARSCESNSSFSPYMIGLTHTFRRMPQQDGQREASTPKTYFVFGIELVVRV
jgi:hypothetical protein